jgi:branched-chain amino acid transport system permease protein
MMLGNPPRLAIITLLAVLLVVPVIVEDSYIRHLFIMAFLYAVIASNWDLTLGYAGIFNFGHLTFFGAGVYTAAIAAKTLGLSPWLAIPLGGVSAALIAAILAAPVVRLKGIYVVLVTFAFSQLILQVILSQSQITGGAQGIVRIPYLSLGDYKFIRDYKLGYYYLAFGLLIASTLFLLWLAGTSFGKSLRAIRDNEDYARARGISVSRQRMLAMIGSAVFTGIAGGFFAIYLRVASPDVFGFGALSLALSMVLIGGVGTIVGPILAALVLTFATEMMAGIRGMEEARFIVVAVGMILVLQFTPGGLLGILRRLRINSADRSRGK